MVQGSVAGLMDCGKKVPFATVAEALAVRRRQRDQSMNIYFCEKHACLHLGHPQPVAAQYRGLPRYHSHAGALQAALVHQAGQREPRKAHVFKIRDAPREFTKLWAIRWGNPLPLHSPLARPVVDIDTARRLFAEMNPTTNDYVIVHQKPSRLS